MNSPVVGSKKKFPAVACLIVTGSLFVLAVIVLELFGNPTVVLDLQLDGKPLPLGVIPVINMNGKAFNSGEKVNIGHNSLSIVLNNAEPITRSIWMFCGTDNLGTISLNSFKGNLRLTTTPSDASFALRQGSDSIRSGVTPAILNDVPAGDYDILISRGGYKEGHPVTILKGETTSLDINLKIADVFLESNPTNADYTLTGNGKKWDGKLPTLISNVPFGDYIYTTSRKGWDIVSPITIEKSGGLTNKTEFPYASIALTSQPDGLMITSGGVDFGKTPVTLNIKPGMYSLTASDGENDLTANINLMPEENASHDFAFHYGTVQLSSQPIGATVTRKGKEIGKTPLSLNHILVGESSVTLSHDGYSSTNFIISASEGLTSEYQVNLISERFLLAMKQAREAFAETNIDSSLNDLSLALSIQPTDSDALQLKEKVEKAKAEAEKEYIIAKAAAKVHMLASLQWLDFNQVIANCTDTTLVQVPVEFNDGYYDNNGKFIVTGHHTEIQTRTDISYNAAKFSQYYAGKTFGFNCPGSWTISKIEKDGSITFKGTALLDKIVATPPLDNPNAFQSLQKGQKVTMKVVASRIEHGFFNTTLYLETVEILDK